MGPWAPPFFSAEDSAQKKRTRYDNFLSKVPLLTGMDAYERSQIADALRRGKGLRLGSLDEPLII